MCVVTNKREDYLRTANNDATCNNCGDILCYPFFAWRGEHPFYLCAPCCGEIKRGIIADIIHLAAINELQGLYCDHVLTREPLSDVEKRIEAREAEWRTSMKNVEVRESEAIRSMQV